MRKALFLTLFFYSLFAAMQCDAQGWEWMKGGQNGVSHGDRVVTDKNENVYVAAMCWENGNFGPYAFSGNGIATCALIKYDSLGNIQWVLPADSSAPCGLETDLFGNEYLFCVYYDSVLHFGGHTLLNAHPGSSSYFIAKVNSEGEVTWLKNVGNINSYGLPGESMGNCIAVDDSGNIYATCAYNHNSVIGSYSLSDTDSTGQNILVIKYDSSGSIIWAKSFGDNNNTWASGIAVTHSNKIYLSGGFKLDTLKFGTTFLTDTTEHTKMFLAQLDNSGNPLWAKTNEGTESDCWAYGLTTDSYGDAVISGGYSTGYLTSSTISFGSATLTTVPLHQLYGFLVKYDSMGNALWSKCMQGQFILSYSTTVDPCDNIWVLSANVVDSSNAPLHDTIDGHIISPPSINYNPIFIAGWSNSGDYITASSLAAGIEGSWNMSIASDKGGNIYITSDTQLDTFIVDGDSVYNSTPPLYLELIINMFVAKYNPNLGCGTDIRISQITGDSSFCIGNTITLSDTTAGGVWSSSNSAVAIVDSATGIVSGVSVGVVNITYSLSTGYVVKAITVVSFPNAAIISGPDSTCEGGWFPITLTDTIKSGIWVGSNAKVTVSGGIVTGQYGGIDTIYYVVANACGADSAMHIVTVSLCADEVSSIASRGNEITIYPNPAHTDITISATGMITTVSISNLVGQPVYSGQYNAPQVQVGVADLPAGVYFVKVNGVAVRKFVKE